MLHMHSVVGIFQTRGAAQKAADILALPNDRISVVAPRPLEAEDAGIGQALGGALGGALGAGAGSSLGTAAASLLLPGVGPVVATGVVAALLLGAGGAVAGAAVGDKLDRTWEVDPTHDPRDVFFYHEALRRGRAIVLALAETTEEAEMIERILAGAGGQRLEAIRETWWLEIRENERAGYMGDFAADENEYRLGFEAALNPKSRDKRLDDSVDASIAYRKGYERGYEYLRNLS
jgi:hypothetical protein